MFRTDLVVESAELIQDLKSQLKEAENRSDRLASALVEIIRKTKGAPVFTNEGEIFYIATTAMSGGEHQ